MFLLFRAVTYATIFVGLLFIYLPARLLAWSGIVRAGAFGWPQIGGVIVGSLGAFVALACVSAFIWIGKGTPAPFDPPRLLVVRGHYRFVRNPMYVGAALVLAGTALFYESFVLLAFLAIFVAATHLLVLLYEEPALRRTFGPEYESYCHSVRRWRPGM